MRVRISSATSKQRAWLDNARGRPFPAALTQPPWSLRHSGLTEIVVLNIAKQAGIIDDEMFTSASETSRACTACSVLMRAPLRAFCPAVLVMMAVITTAMAGPLLSIIFTPRQLVLEKAADNAANAKAKTGGRALAPGVAQLVVLVHDTARGSKLLSAAVSTLAPNMRAHLDVAQFSPPGELHTQTEMGTGLLRSPEEVNARGTLKEQLAGVERRGLTSSVTVRTTEDPVADSLMHIRARNPQLVVTDWPQHEDERARLKELVVASPCTVVLWGGYSPNMPSSSGGASPPPPPPGSAAPREGGKDEGMSSRGNGLASLSQALPGATRPLPKPRPTLRELLRNEAAQDELADEVMAKVWHGLATMQAAISARLPAFMRADAAATAGHDEDIDDDEEEGHGGEGHGRVRVKSDSSVVTPHTMAVAAASSLSPKFSKLMVTGWPENDRDCAELVKFLHDVEHECVAKRMSLEARRSVAPGSHNGSYATDAEMMPAIGEDSEVQIVIPGDGNVAGNGVLLCPKPGLPRIASEDNLDSVTTVGPMLSKMLGAALQQQRGEQ
jgi:hypothetical protein